MVHPAVNFNVGGGGTILLVAQNIGPPIEELSSGSITGIG